MKQHAGNRLIAFKAGLLALLLVTLSVQAKLPFVPFPKDVKVKVVGEDIVVNGLPIMAYEFHSSQSLKDVLEFYQNTWQVSRNKSDTKQSYLTSELPGWKVISRLESGHNITVQLSEDGIKGVRGLVGVSPLPSYLEAGFKGTTIYKVPQLGKAKILSLVQSDDNGKKSETYWIDNSENVDTSLNRYRQYFENNGYSVINKRLIENNQVHASSAILIARSKKDSVRMDAVDLNGKTRIVVIRVIR